MATVVSANTITAVATMVLSTFMGTSLVADSCLYLLEHGRRGFLTPELHQSALASWNWAGRVDSRAPVPGAKTVQDVEDVVEVLLPLQRVGPFLVDEPLMEDE